MLGIIKLINVIGSVVLLILVGFLAKKAGLAKKEHSKLLNTIIIYLALPALIFISISKASISVDLVKIPLVAVGTMLIMLLLSFIIGSFFKFNRQLLGSFLLVSAIGNTGYLGYPLAQKIAGQPGLTKAIFYDIFGTVLVILTIGLIIAEVYGAKGKKINKVKEIFTFPPLLALALAFILKPVALPAIVMNTLSALGTITIPLIMISVGLSLESSAIGSYKLSVGLAFILKLVVSPLIAFLLAGLFYLGRGFLLIVILEAAMPPALLTLVFGLKYELDNTYLASVIFVLTVASLVTVPLILLLV